MGSNQSYLNSINFKVYQKLRQTKRPLTTITVRSRELKTSPSHKPVNMPLVVPDVSDNERASWEAKLLGKKLTDSTSNNVVSYLAYIITLNLLGPVYLFLIQYPL